MGCEKEKYFLRNFIIISMKRNYRRDIRSFIYFVVYLCINLIFDQQMKTTHVHLSQIHDIKILPTYVMLLCSIPHPFFLC